MTQRLEVHRDYVDFFQRELEALAEKAGAVSYSQWVEVIDEAANDEFDLATREYCEQLTWPILSDHDRVRACFRLHFALWFAVHVPWETTERPLSGAAYLEDMLIRKFWLHKRAWIAGNWAGMDVVSS